MKAVDRDDRDGPRGGFTSIFARFVVRARWFVIVGWIAATIASALLLPDIKSAQTGSLGDLVANDAGAIDTEERSIDLFKFPVLSRTVIVQRNANGFSANAEARIYDRAVRITRGRVPGFEDIRFALPVVNDAAGRIATGDHAGRPTTALTYLFFPVSIGPEDQSETALRLIDEQINRGSDGTVGLTGAVPARAEQVAAITDALPLVELATVLLITLAVGLHYRAPGAPLANIAAVAITYIVSIHMIGGVGQKVGISVPEEVEPVMVALLFGIVTDYTIFFISRFRSRIEEGVKPREAAEVITADLLPTIFTAAISVAAASAVLVTAQLGFFRAFGPGTALAVLIALAVVTTFIPAVLAVFGERILWPGRSNGQAKRSIEPLRRFGELRSALLRLPTERPVPMIICTVVPLLALTLLVGRMELANTLISGLPSDSPTRGALAEARKGFEPGAVSPVMVLVEAPGITDEQEQLDDLQSRLLKRPHVAGVIGPGQLQGQSIDLGAVTSPTGNAVRYLLVLDVNPLGGRAVDVATNLDRDLERLLSSSGLPNATANLAGDTALAAETVTETESDLARILPLAALAVFVVLAIFLRALIAPLYLVLTSVLALGASLGLTIVVFQDLLGYGELTFFVPFAGIVLLIALGSDYNVYLVGRVWAEARETPLREAVVIAGARASSAITIAGLILALSFSLLAIVPLRPFHELAFILATGLLIDSVIVRSLLAPSLITLVGEFSAWPGKSLQPPAAIDPEHPGPIPDKLAE